MIDRLLETDEVRHGVVSRKLLRSKALQTIYAARIKHSSDIYESNRELMQSIEKTYELYHLILNLLLDVQFFAEREYNDKEQRFEILRDEANLALLRTSPLRLIIENSFLCQLRTNKALDEYSSTGRASLESYPQIGLDILASVLNSGYFKDYAGLSERTYEDDKQLCRSILKYEFERNAYLKDIVRDINIYWGDDLEVVLISVRRTIGMFDLDNGAEQQLLPMFTTDDDKYFVAELVKQVVLRYKELEEQISKYLIKWVVDRTSLMDKIIMMAAIVEFERFPDIPMQITINEYLEYIKVYSMPDNVTYVNGVLNNIARDMRAEGRMNKDNATFINR